MISYALGFLMLLIIELPGLCYNEVTINTATAIRWEITDYI